MANVRLKLRQCCWPILVCNERNDPYCIVVFKSSACSKQLNAMTYSLNGVVGGFPQRTLVFLAAYFRVRVEAVARPRVNGHVPETTVRVVGNVRFGVAEMFENIIVDVYLLINVHGRGSV